MKVSISDRIHNFWLDDRTTVSIEPGERILRREVAMPLIEAGLAESKEMEDDGTDG